MAFKHTLAAALILFLGISGAISSARAEPLKIVGFGDSLMAGFGLGPDEGFTQKLEAALRAKGHDVTVTNAGVSGDTSSGGLSPLYPFFLDGVAGDATFQLEDGLHPNAKGIDRMVERILPDVEKAIAVVKGNS
ncbi:MAG: hypothetical protein E5W09_26620 [Mesorhizobium sp.]|nr:MAG: hypothetical protein E5W09_26620 [Mesorhizobium sp.]